jgi:hypothetical protein
MAEQLTIGEKRIRVQFGKIESQYTDQRLKGKCAELINEIDGIRAGLRIQDTADERENSEKRNEQGRLIALAITAIEQASMWTTKALHV